jgi:hypothetical protein
VARFILHGARKLLMALKMQALTHRNFARALAFIFIASASLQTVCGGAYLAIVGPAPLRFFHIITNSPVQILPTLVMGNESVEENNADMSGSSTNSTGVISADIEHYSTNEVAVASEITGASQSPAEGGITTSHNASAVVTPQMLAEYFLPMRTGTNSSAISISMPVGFSPPEARTPLSSQATYKTE